MEDHSNQLRTRFGSDFYRWIIQILSFPRRGYTRLRRENSRRRRVRVARLGGRRVLKLKRFKFRWLSPLALLVKLRDAYVDLMLATSSRISSVDFMAMSGFPGAVPGTNCAPFGHIPDKEYDRKILVELYRSMAQNITI